MSSKFLNCILCISFKKGFSKSPLYIYGSSPKSLFLGPLFWNSPGASDRCRIHVERCWLGLLSSSLRESHPRATLPKEEEHKVTRLWAIGREVCCLTSPYSVHWANSATDKLERGSASSRAFTRPVSILQVRDCSTGRTGKAPLWVGCVTLSFKSPTAFLLGSSLHLSHESRQVGA